MENLPTILLLAGLGALCLAAVSLVAGLRNQPKFRRIDLMSENEEEFFGRLHDVVPPGWRVFPQVAMTALIEPAVPRRSKRWIALFNEIGNLRVDYVVCDDTFKPRVVVELDDKSHARKSKADRLRDMRLAAVGLPTIRIPSSSKPSSVELSSRLVAAWS